MKRNTFGRLAMILGLAVSLLGAFAAPGAAQITRPVVLLPPPPPTLPSANDLVEITAGDSHTCVRKYNGMVYCWGLDSSGQIGVASTANCHDNVAPSVTTPCVDKPNYVTTLIAPAQIVAGDAHTCSLSGGVASCWGSNGSGEIGNGTQSSQTMPQNVFGSVVFTSLAAGPSATCGVSSSGVFCWGLLPYGAQPTGSTSLGQSSPHQSYALKPVQISSFSGYRNLTVGYQFACFVYITGGWGENDCQGKDDHLQLGVNPTTQNADGSSYTWLPDDTYTIPATSTTPASSYDVLFAPFAVRSSTGVDSNGSPHVLRAAAGRDFVCADVTDGSVQCVGNDSAGQLEYGASKADRWSASKVSDSNGNPMTLHGVTSGANHACALDGSGSAFCWGGDFGFSATQVSTTLKFRAVAAGSRHTCGIGTNNYVYCWGDNKDGQLGIGAGTLSPTSSSTPVQIDPASFN